jgi:hypothetical protein
MKRPDLHALGPVVNGKRTFMIRRKGKVVHQVLIRHIDVREPLRAL